MDDLSCLTSQLKELLDTPVDQNDKEDIIFKHITTAEKLNYIVDDFPPDLDWFNTLEPLSASHLQGKIIVLDFFTYCCINCLHIIPHLRELEENFSVADGLVVIGIHSAKFENEKDSQNILKALKRYNIAHPVVNDKDCYLWNKLNISCWPTLVILGPQRQPIFVLVGEGHREELLLFVKVALKFYKKSISSHSLPLSHCDQIITSSFLSFPGKITRWESLFAVSDSGNHRIVLFDKNGHVKFKIGGTSRGFKNGSFETARFNSPQGLAFSDEKTVYVADTDNHAIRRIDLAALTVTTVVGNGQQGTDLTGGQIGVLQEISSPWDVCVVPSSDVDVTTSGSFAPVKTPLIMVGSTPPPPPAPHLFGSPSTPSPMSAAAPPPPPPSMSAAAPPPPPPPMSVAAPPPPPPSMSAAHPPPLPPSPSFFKNNANKDNSKCKVLLIAAAGTHQIWAYFIESSFWWRGKKYDEKVCVAIAGTGKEENRNNRYPMMASFAQPSGLSYSKELKAVFIADSESSSIRKLSLKDGSVSHVAGGARSPDDLFSFGDLDGKAFEAKFQHPLGVAWSSKQKSLFVCDTYNHKMKRIDISDGGCVSLWPTPGLFNEPSGCCFNESEDILYICDTNNNCIRAVSLLDDNVRRIDLKEKSQTGAGSSLKDIWEAESYMSKSGGNLTLKIDFSPPEVHGKWKLNIDESKVKVAQVEGKLKSNDIEFNFEIASSDVDDILKIIFDLVLCGNETCTFRKVDLLVHVKRKDGPKESVVCKVSRNLT